MRVTRFLLLLWVILLQGCTNVTGDAIRRIESTSMNSGQLIAYSSMFFKGAGYECAAEEGGQGLRCDKPLRDMMIHQARAVVEMYSGGSEDDQFSLVTTRWDEGLIPGEFISTEFENPDVAGFCGSLEVSGKGVCRLEE